MPRTISIDGIQYALREMTIDDLESRLDIELLPAVNIEKKELYIRPDDVISYESLYRCSKIQKEYTSGTYSI